MTIENVKTNRGRASAALFFVHVAWLIGPSLTVVAAVGAAIIAITGGKYVAIFLNGVCHV